jgi:hypothetical protein
MCRITEFGENNLKWRRYRYFFGQALCRWVWGWGKIVRFVSGGGNRAFTSARLPPRELLLFVIFRRTCRQGFKLEVTFAEKILVALEI